MAATTLQCASCDRDAPPPTSDEARDWDSVSDPELGLTGLCPECGASPETRQRVLDEMRRRKLRHGRQTTADSLVFVRGKAKTADALTIEDVKWVADRDRAQEAQEGAWMKWFEDRLIHLADEEAR